MSPRQGDIVLRGSTELGYQLLDAISFEPLAGVMSLDDAIDVALSMTSGAVWRQQVDTAGQASGPLVQLLCNASERQSGV